MPKLPAQPQESPSAGNSVAPLLWLLGITIASVGGMYVYSVNKSAPERPSYVAAPQRTPTATPIRQPPAVKPSIAVRPAEEKPPIGRTHTLSVGQIRYCLAEEIRLKAAESVLDNYNERHVDRFNDYVDDYNSRCGQYRYRNDSLGAARRDITPYTEVIRAEGIARFSYEVPAMVSEVGRSPTETSNGDNQANADLPGYPLDARSVSPADLETFLDAADEIFQAYEPDEAQKTEPDQTGISSIGSRWRDNPIEMEPQRLVSEEAAAIVQSDSRGVSASPPQIPPASQSRIQNAVPIRPPRLSFPKRAAERGVSGTCDVVFDLDSRGKPSNVVATCSSPLFVSEAQRAISRTEFSPKMVDGRPVEQRNMVFPLEFVFE